MSDVRDGRYPCPPGNCPSEKGGGSPVLLVGSMGRRAAPFLGRRTVTGPLSAIVAAYWRLVTTLHATITNRAQLVEAEDPVKEGVGVLVLVCMGISDVSSLPAHGMFRPAPTRIKKIIIIE